MKFLFSILFFLSCANAQIRNCNCVAFRLNSVQDYFVTAGQMAIMEIFRQEKVNLSIGIVSNLYGTDTTLVSYINTALGDSTRGIEVVANGYDFENMTALTLDQQKTLIGNMATQIRQKTGVTPKVLIPPFNIFNANTMTALQYNNFTHISAEVDTDSPPYDYNYPPVWRFPIGAATNDMKNDINLVGVPYTVTYNQIRNQISSYGFSAVMMHGNEFHNYTINGTLNENQLNQTQLNQLLLLIRAVKAANITITVLGKINQFFPPIPTTGVIPTTAIPTTSIPTTGVPTTSVPTTAIPTTSIPTTAMPTTSSPPSSSSQYSTSRVTSSTNQTTNPTITGIQTAASTITTTGEVDSSASKLISLIGLVTLFLML